MEPRALAPTYFHLSNHQSLSENICDGVVSSPTLYRITNVRLNEPYLKNVFPSGFNSSQSRDSPVKCGVFIGGSLSSSGKNIIKGKSDAMKVNGSIRKLQYPYSIGEWARGDIVKDDYNLHGSNDDEYADVAGTYFKEIGKNSFIADALPDLTDGMDASLKIKPCVTGYQPSSGPHRRLCIPALRDDGAHSRPLLATSILPSMHPHRTRVSLHHKTRKAKPVITQESSTGALVEVSHTAVPQLLDDVIAVELYPFEHMFGAGSVADSAAAARKLNIDSGLSFRMIRSIAVRCYRESTESGIGTAPGATTLGDSSVTFTRVPWQSLELEVALHYYHCEARAWRPLRRRMDWDMAKLAALTTRRPLQLTYTIFHTDGGGEMGGRRIDAGPVRCAGEGSIIGRSPLSVVSATSSTPPSGPNLLPLDDEDTTVGEGGRPGLLGSVHSHRSFDDSLISAGTGVTRVVPALAKQTVLALALEQRLMLRRN